MYSGKWLRQKNIKYQGKNNQTLTYEAVERTTRKPGQVCDGVDVIPILKKKNQKDQLVFIANYRPPVDQFVLEFPAGLLDNTDIEENALRELKEETGYTGSKIITQTQQQVIAYEDPWKSNECGYILQIEIDGDSPENLSPQQHLEESENIRVHLLEINKDLINNLLKLAQDNNYLILAKMWSFVQGLAFAQAFN